MPSIVEIARKFAAEHPRFANQSTAWSQCDIASDLFMNYAVSVGYDGPLCRYSFSAVVGHIAAEDRPNPAPHIYDVFELDGRTKQNDIVGDYLCTWHCIVEAAAENLLIDFTARQYHSSYEYPLFIPRTPELADAAMAGAR